MVASTVIKAGPVPAFVGPPNTGVNAPELEPTVKAEILFDPWLAANNTELVESMARATGVVPAAYGEPGKGVRVPVAAWTEKPTILLLVESARYRNLPADGSIAIPAAATPPVNGAPGNGVKTPVGEKV